MAKKIILIARVKVNADDLPVALAWAVKCGYKYDNDAELLFDAYTDTAIDGVIQDVEQET